MRSVWDEAGQGRASNGIPSPSNGVGGSFGWPGGRDERGRGGFMGDQYPARQATGPSQSGNNLTALGQRGGSSLGRGGGVSGRGGWNPSSSAGHTAGRGFPSTPGEGPSQIYTGTRGGMAGSPEPTPHRGGSRKHGTGTARGAAGWRGGAGRTGSAARYDACAKFSHDVSRFVVPTAPRGYQGGGLGVDGSPLEPPPRPLRTAVVLRWTRPDRVPYHSIDVFVKIGGEYSLLGVSIHFMGQEGQDNYITVREALRSVPLTREDCDVVYVRNISSVTHARKAPL